MHVFSVLPQFLYVYISRYICVCICALYTQMRLVIIDIYYKRVSVL